MKSFIQKWMIYIFYRLFMLTWRTKIIESPEFTKSYKNKVPMILAFFHGDELACLQIVQRYGLATMVSTSKDGSFMDFVVKRLGGNTSRGSSTRGGVQALKGLIGLMKRGYPAAIAVDGPKGPIYKVKPGVFELSRLGKAEIYTLTSIAPKAKHFPKAWNKTYLPYPFSPVYILIEKAFSPLTKDQNPKDPKLAEELEKKLFDSKHQLGKLIADA